MSEVLRLLSQYYSVVCSRSFLYHLVVIPHWSWEDVSVASTYSSAISDVLNLNAALTIHIGFLSLNVPSFLSLWCYLQWFILDLFSCFLSYIILLRGLAHQMQMGVIFISVLCFPAVLLENNLSSVANGNSKMT